jgi:hypothetical protein
LNYYQDELSKAIEFYAYRDEEKIKFHEMIGKIIRKNYFEPVTLFTISFNTVDLILKEILDN